MHISLFFKKCASAPNTEIEFADYRLADVRRVFRKDPRVRWGAPVRQCAEYIKPTYGNHRDVFPIPGRMVARCDRCLPIVLYSARSKEFK